MLGAYVCVFFSLIMHARSFPAEHFKGLPYEFPFISRASWGALTPNLTRPLATPVPYVVIHHTYLPGACLDLPSCSAAMRSMQRYHQSLEWGDIGYNFCVGSDGSVYEGRGWQTLGAHARSANPVSIGICLIGDWRFKLPPLQQLTTTKALITAGLQRGFIKEDYRLITHRQVSATECPGDTLFEEIKTWDHYWAANFTSPH